MANGSDQIEAIIDRTSVVEVLALIADICSEKADHIRSNWQDRRTAAVWDRAARTVIAAANKVDV